MDDDNSLPIVIIIVVVLLLFDCTVGSAISSTLNPLIEPISEPSSSLLKFAVFVLTSPFNILLVIIGMIFRTMDAQRE